MKSWDTICFLFIALNYNVTIIGKFWITHMILLRLMVILLVAYPLYQDEQLHFICNSQQPGCASMCYDGFAPVSHSRFWLIEALSVLLPYAVFCTYVLHNVVRQVVKTYSSPDQQYEEINPLSGHKVTKKSSKEPSRRRIACGPNEIDIPDLSRAYAVQLILRIFIEVGFVAGDYCIFGFFVPRHYLCSLMPCPNKVACSVSRPSEKSIMLVFMWVLSGFSFLLSLIDLFFAFRTNIVRNRRNKLLFERFELDEKCCTGLHQGAKPEADLFSHGTTSMADDWTNCLVGCEVQESHNEARGAEKAHAL